MRGARFSLLSAAAIIAVCTTLAGCSGSGHTSGGTTAAGRQSADSLLGKWRLNGPIPKAAIANQIYEIKFTDAHHVQITYVPGYTAFGPLALRADQVQRLSKLHTISTSYDNVGNNKIRVIIGSQAVYYRISIDNDKMFLTPSEAPSGDAKADAEIAAAEPTTVFVRETQ